MQIAAKKCGDVCRDCYNATKLSYRATMCKEGKNQISMEAVRGKNSLIIQPHHRLCSLQLNPSYILSSTASAIYKEPHSSPHYSSEISLIRQNRWGAISFSE